MLGNLNPAIDNHSKAIQINTGYFEALNDRGAAYFQNGNCDLAIADYCAAIKIKSDDVIAYTNRAADYCQKREYDLAIADCDSAIDLDPKNIDAYTSGLIYNPNQGTRRFFWKNPRKEPIIR